ASCTPSIATPSGRKRSVRSWRRATPTAPGGSASCPCPPARPRVCRGRSTRASISCCSVARRRSTRRDSDMAKVLVVDDSLSVRKVVERARLGGQMEVVSAATGSEALERIERDEPDVVVCDVLMPDKDGYEICQYVKRHPRLARTPVLLMSGIVNDEVRERA